MATDHTGTGSNRVRRGGLMVWALVALGVAVTGGAAAFVLASPGRSEATPRTADMIAASRTTFDIATTATGELQAKNQIEIRSKLETQSTITEIAPEGTRVKAGDVLVRLNADTIQTEVDEESLRVESAKAELIAAENSYEIQKSENESKLRQAKLKVELARLALEQWEKGEDKQKLKDIELALDSTQKDLDRLEEKFARSEDLWKQGFLSKNERDLDEISLRKARAEREKALLEEQTYKSYQQPKDRKQKESDLAEAIAELERTERQNEIELASKDAEQVNKRRQLQMREERLSRLQEQLAACTMTAPSDGLVVYWSSARGGDMMMFDSRGPLQVGRQVMPQEPLIALPDTTEMIANVRVHESLAGRIRPGQPAVLKIDALQGRTFAGRVESIGVLAESGGWRDPNRREYAVKIALLVEDAAEAGLKPSMRCEAEITLGLVQDAVAVPIQAVFSDGPVRFVYASTGGKYKRVPVKVGQRSDTYAEILAGVDAGARVLVREPAASEVVREPWDPKQLELAGLTVGEDGQPVPVRPAGGPPAMTTMTVAPGQGTPPGAAVVQPVAAGPAGGVVITPAPAGDAGATQGTPSGAPRIMRQGGPGADARPAGAKTAEPAVAEKTAEKTTEPLSQEPTSQPAERTTGG